MTLDKGEVLAKNGQIRSVKTLAEDRYFTTPIYKKIRCMIHYNQLTLRFKGDYGLMFRAYDDGVAYRLYGEKRQHNDSRWRRQLQFQETMTKPFLPFVNDYRNKDKFTTSFEAHYSDLNLSSVPVDSLAFLPCCRVLGRKSSDPRSRSARAGMPVNRQEQRINSGHCSAPRRSRELIFIPVVVYKRKKGFVIVFENWSWRLHRLSLCCLFSP